MKLSRPSAFAFIVLSGFIVTSVTFHVENAENGDVLFHCAEAYRAWDWDGSDIVVDSSDVGKIIYKAENWT